MRAVDHLLIGKLYEAAAGMTPWSPVLGDLLREMRVTSLQLVTIDTSQGRLLVSEQPWSAFDKTTVDGTMEYLREWHRHDPHLALTATLPIGQVMNSAESFPIAQYSNHPFYREFWSAYGVKTLLAAKCAEDASHLTMIGLMRNEPLPLFSGDEISVMEQYVGHLVTAFRIVRHLSVQQIEATAGRGLLAAAQRPMALLDSAGRLLMSNQSAQEVFNRGEVLYLADGALRCRRSKDQAALSRYLKQMGKSEKPGTCDPPRRIALKIAAELPQRDLLLCSLWNMRPESTMHAFGPRPVALLTIATPTEYTHIDPVFLASMFDLTPAECRIAIGLMEGKTSQEIAMAHRVTIATVRAQIRSVLEKTNTHRQAALVALLLRVAAN